MKSPKLKWTHETMAAAASRLFSAGLLLMFILPVHSVFSSFSFSPLITDARSMRNLSTSTAAEWILHSTVRNVDFFYRISECNGNNVVFLKFNNRNAKEVKVSWKEVFKTQFDAQKEGFKGMKQLLLPPGETAASDCASTSLKQCIVLASQVTPAYNAEIRQFSFKNITVAE